MSKKSRKRNKMIAAILGATALGALSKSPRGISGDERRDIRKSLVGSRNKKDLMTVGKTMVGSPVKTAVDYDANPRERRDILSKAKAAATKARKAVEKRRDAGDLSPTMPKRSGQEYGFGFGVMAKKGKMVKARGGGLAKGGMKPTKLY
tara:strand:- start:7555 stop:8001 length:447 start_codon:yes stop_codon:yes gene_type:complete